MQKSLTPNTNMMILQHQVTWLLQNERFQMISVPIVTDLNQMTPILKFEEWKLATVEGDMPTIEESYILEET